MPSNVLKLVKELKRKTDEVNALLRQVGFDTEAEGFGVLSQIPDDVVNKVKQLAEGGSAPAAAAPAAAPGKAAAPAGGSGAAGAGRRPRPQDDTGALDLKEATPKRRTGGKDFFGTKPAAEPEPEPKTEMPRLGDKVKVLEPAPTPPARKTAPAAGNGAGAAAASAPARQPGAAPAAPAQRGPSEVRQIRQTPQGAQASGGSAAAAAPTRQAKPDLSSGPRILSMPDPAERARLQAQRNAPARPGGRPGAGPARGGAPAAGGPPPSGGGQDQKKKPGARGKDRRGGEDELSGGRRGRRDVALGDDETVRSRKRVFKVAGGPRIQEAGAVQYHLKIPGPMPLRDIAQGTGVKVAQIVRFLLNELGTKANINYVASVEESELIAEHFGVPHSVALEQQATDELVQFEQIDSEKLVGRPPVVTIMGHVDHGKTKLLDTIRTTNVVAKEAGGITQHIGAYQVEKKGKHITFIDTPGHEAFTAMRARGSQVTDIVILVVAADDGVMPQTIEAIQHAKAAEVPIIVAVNKIDKADAQPDRVKQQLSDHGLVPEEWGGDTVYCNVSALKGDGIDELLEMILLTAELADPKADPHAPPYGVVIESKVDPGIGVVATVLVQQGTMVKGQFILSGTTVGRIKRMESDLGSEVASAGPSAPARIIGFTEPPENGDKVYCFNNKKQAQAIADQREAEARVRAAAKASQRMSLEKFLAKSEGKEIKELNIVLKADVGGSAEALAESLAKLEVEGAKCHIVSTGVGQINEHDINLATASDAVVVGFHTGITSGAKRLAEKEHIEVRLYDIIYKVTEDIEKAMKGLLEPEYEEKSLGKLEVRAIFKQEKGTCVAGGYVLDGTIKRGGKFRLKRGKETIFEGSLPGLKRFKDDVREVQSGYECGVLLETGANNPVQEGDILEMYEMVLKPRL
ncbi:translation initiation factor IF-2 [bacterium]|nr:translation initiation factor IF-2 [bacterium]